MSDEESRSRSHGNAVRKSSSSTTINSHNLESKSHHSNHHQSKNNETTNNENKTNNHSSRALTRSSSENRKVEKILPKKPENTNNDDSSESKESTASSRSKSRSSNNKSSGQRSSRKENIASTTGIISYSKNLTGSRRNRSVNQHPKRTENNEENIRLSKSAHSLKNDDNEDHSNKSEIRRRRSNSNINDKTRDKKVRTPDNSSHRNRSSSGEKKQTLSLTNVVSVDYYFNEEYPQPFTGSLVNKVNGRTSKINLKQDELLQYVKPVILGPTYCTRRGMSSASSDISLASTYSKSSKLSRQSSQNDHHSVGILSSSHEKRSRSVSQKSDLLFSKLFADDDPVTSFNFDFATAYTLEHEDLIIDEKGALNNFPSIEDIEAHKIDFSDDQKTVIAALTSIFHSEEIPQEYPSLTKTVSPYKNDIVISNSRRVKSIEKISATSFFEFRFGSDITEFAPDRLHVFTWHNLGIPASQIAKNLLYYFGSLREAANVRAPIRAISQYIVLWIKYFPDDFGPKSVSAELVLQLLKNMASRSKASISFINIIGSLIVDIHNSSIKPEEIYEPLKQPIYKEITKVNNLINLSLDPYIVANHFAHIDLQYIHILQRSEFVNNKWNTEISLSNPNETPLFHNLLGRFNETVSFIASSILVDSEKRRARNISYWIKMMYYARRVHNYNLLAIIDAGLSCFPIKRLKNSWRLVNDNALIAFNRLHNFFKKGENQNEMIADPRNTIPFIGIFLAQLSQVNLDDTKTTLRNVHGAAYNLDVQRKCLNIVDQIFYPWGSDIELEIDEKILHECIKLTGKARQPKDLILPSISYEPARNDEKDIISEYITRF